MKQLNDIYSMVDTFYERFNNKVWDLDSRHRNELFHLWTMKKRYKEMCAEEGKKAVDRKMLISREQSRRIAAIRKFAAHRYAVNEPSGE